MDAWSADQLKKMQAGGNDKLNQFFKQYGVDKYTDIRDKYNNRVAEVYREKIKADVEGRPFTPPAPSSLQVSLPSKAAPASSGMANRPGMTSGKASGDEWGDWGGSGGGTGAAAASGGGSGFSNNSEYSKAQYMASAANKEEFFQRRMMENQTRPDHLPPSQGGKYVGFGSAPPPRPSQAAPVDEVGALLSKGLQLAGVAAAQAGTVVRSGTAQVNQLLQEKQVGEVVQQTTQKAAALAQTGWTGLRSLYANVAGQVEAVAKDSGYSLNLGSKAVAETLQEQQLREQLERQYQQQYGAGGGVGMGSGQQGGYGSGNSSGSYQPPQPQAGYGGGVGGSSRQGSAGAGAGGFSGFDAGDNSWDNGWGSGGAAAGGAPTPPRPTSAAASRTPPRTSPSPSGRTSPLPSSYHKSSSAPVLPGNAGASAEDDWGKW